MLGSIGANAVGQPPQTLRLADHGWSSPGDRAIWEQVCITEQRHWQYPSFLKFAAQKGKLITRSREQLVGDDEWYRSAEFHETTRMVGLDDKIASALRTGHPLALDLFTILHPWGDPLFLPRDRRLIRLFHHRFPAISARPG